MSNRKSAKMTCPLYETEDVYVEEDDKFSDSSTIRSFSCGDSSKISSYIKSSSYFDNEIYRSKNFEVVSTSEHSDYENEEITFENEYNRNPSCMKIRRIDMSPEAEEKRREAFEKWLKIVNEREKQRKRLKKERIEAERLRQMEKEEIRKLENDAKVKEWNERKRRETQKKMCRLNEMKQASLEKMPVQKEFKKALRFEEWVAKKNENLQKLKTQQVKEKEKIKDYIKVRENISATSYKKWMQTSKNTAKPVPFNRGLESLRGSTTTMYVNPNAWKPLD